MSVLVLKVNPGVVSSPDGTVLLNVVGVACILGFTTTLVHLPGLGAQQEMIPSGFRGRALLSASDITTVKVSPIY